MVHTQLNCERIIQDIGKSDRFTLRVSPSDLRATRQHAVHSWCRVKLAVEDNGKGLADHSFSHSSENVRTIAGHFEIDLKTTSLRLRDIGIIDDFTSRFWNELNKHATLKDFTRLTIFIFLSEHFIADRIFVLCSRVRAQGLMHRPELEASWLFQVFQHLWVILSGQASDLNLDRVIANRTNDRLSHTVTVQTTTHDFDGVL